MYGLSSVMIRLVIFAHSVFSEDLLVLFPLNNSLRLYTKKTYPVDNLKDKVSIESKQEFLVCALSCDITYRENDYAN